MDFRFLNTTKYKLHLQAGNHVKSSSIGNNPFLKLNKAVAVDDNIDKRLCCPVQIKLNTKELKIGYVYSSFCDCMTGLEQTNYCRARPIILSCVHQIVTKTR
jgi:hypothetical protein